ncbi:hypothetical protein GCK72_001865 [Caenorhabditis remanei]|uniref:Uncharacterized protein n=1 Tax=Caenorhabditis remanei TaxID=31234 RepID=A0A6A5HQ66_CAERE|nr:hypothetical protein GCK72_001865 [Caenorhabditis remanei]KAF1770048.1 hypothetical protein GCK72_001865 [Caenorhabditis remanei]
MRDRETAKFDVKTFPQLLDHARAWRPEMRSLTSQGFSKLGLMRHTDGRLHVYAISAQNGTQNIVTGEIPLELTQQKEENDLKITVRLKTTVCNVEALLRKAAPSDEFAMLCERQRASVVQGITDYEIGSKEITLMAGDQVFLYTPHSGGVKPIATGAIELPSSPPPNVRKSSNRNAVEPMDVSEGAFGPGVKGCSVEAQHSTSASPANKTSGKNDSSLPPSSNFIFTAKLCPSDSDCLAYVLNKQVHIEQDGTLIHRTTSDSKHITNGVPSYVVQEEMERFEGIWWSETHKRLLYEHVNEEEVAEAQFGINGDNPSTPMKYPRVGTKNAMSQLRMVIIENGMVYDVSLNNQVLLNLFPQYEYITRAGFFSDGTSVWVQLMNRDQSECSLVLIPYSAFDLPKELRGNTPPRNTQTVEDMKIGHWNQNSQEAAEKPPRGKLQIPVTIHKSRRHNSWINSHNAIHPLKVTDEERPFYEFIYCLERPHGSCISLISAELDPTGNLVHCGEEILMAETYSINKSMGIVVDENKNLVYYVANESHPTEWNVCVSNYRTKKHAQLTENGICFKCERANGRLAVDIDHGFACWMTSVGSPAQCRFYSFKWMDGEELPKALHTLNVSLTGTDNPPEQQVDVPEMVEFQSRRTGLMHYGLILRPNNFDPYKKYPVFHYVYGGPGIQIVHNDYSWVQFIRFARLGYVVVVLDNRGSAHRGIEFENFISRKMGTVEVEDQVDGLQTLAERTGGFMDMSRVIVHGWSYGGYMALQLLAKHPKVYSAAIAGGAVSDWRLYDTAYTERYMGYPVIDQVYTESSVLNLVGKLPDEPNRLMLVHGLMDENVHFSHLTTLIDECIKKGKWHELLIFPRERHGIRGNDASIYLDARMMYFAQNAIQNIVLSKDDSAQGGAPV